MNSFQRNYIYYNPVYPSVHVVDFPLCFDMHIQFFYLIPITIVLQILYIIFKPTISLNCKIKTTKFPNKLKTYEKLTSNLNKIFSIYLNFNLMESGPNNDAITGEYSIK